MKIFTFKMCLYVIIIGIYPIMHGISQETSPNSSSIDGALTNLSERIRSIAAIKNKVEDKYTSQALSDTTLYSSLAQISKPMAPFAYGKYFIFIYYSTQTSDRVFISFAHDNYSQLFSYITLEANAHVRVFVLPRAHTTQYVRYRLVINNLWTHDPYNPHGETDDYGIQISTATIPPSPPIFLPPIVKLNENTIRFYLYAHMGIFPLKDTRLNYIDYSELSSSQIYLAGNFTGWNPYLIPMNPVKNVDNLYYADVQVRDGTYYYYYNVGVADVLDPKNNNIATRSITNTYVNQVEIRTEIKETTGAMTLVVSTTDTQ